MPQARGCGSHEVTTPHSIDISLNIQHQMVLRRAMLKNNMRYVATCSTPQARGLGSQEAAHLPSHSWQSRARPEHRHLDLFVEFPAPQAQQSLVQRLAGLSGRWHDRRYQMGHSRLGEQGLALAGRVQPSSHQRSPLSAYPAPTHRSCQQEPALLYLALYESWLCGSEFDQCMALWEQFVGVSSLNVWLFGSNLPAPSSIDCGAAVKSNLQA
jgi:hypothetical protein